MIEESPPPNRFGYYPKQDAQRLVVWLREQGLHAQVGLDRDFAAQNHGATAISNRLRRRVSNGAAVSGYYALVPVTEAERALYLIQGSRWARVEQPDEGEEPDFDADPRWCPACKAERPPKSERCLQCGGETVDILRKGRAEGKPPLVVYVAAAASLAWVLARMFGRGGVF